LVRSSVALVTVAPASFASGMLMTMRSSPMLVRPAKSAVLPRKLPSGFAE
jgi:hypothetical protein